MFKYASVKSVIDIANYPHFSPLEETFILEQWIKNERNHGENNEFRPVLEKANFFAKYGLTPVYYADATGTRLFVTSQEFIDNKMN
jgi:hypothetical protein